MIWLAFMFVFALGDVAVVMSPLFTLGVDGGKWAGLQGSYGAMTWHMRLPGVSR